MTYDLALDEPRPNDDIYSYDDVHIIVDKDSARYMEEEITVDYDEAVGAYKLKSPERILTGYYHV